MHGGGENGTGRRGPEGWLTPVKSPIGCRFGCRCVGLGEVAEQRRRAAGCRGQGGRPANLGALPLLLLVNAHHPGVRPLLSLGSVALGRGAARAFVLVGVPGVVVSGRRCPRCRLWDVVKAGPGRCRRVHRGRCVGCCPFASDWRVGGAEGWVGGEVMILLSCSGARSRSHT